MTTRFTELMGIDFPLVQAPIGSASCPALAAAVSAAGGLGMLSGTWRTPAALRTLIHETKALTSRPFGVNLVLAWDMAERVRVCLDEDVALLSFFWGDPAPYLGAVQASGTRVCQTVASAAEARQMAALGVDVLVAQGWEAGGHVWGETGSMALIPAVVDAAPEIPVLAAGGIGDGRGVVAARALGADGVWLGTRFLLAEEARVHPRYQELLLAADTSETRYTTRFGGGWPDAPHRVLRREADWSAADTVIAHYGDGEPIYGDSSNLPAPDVVGRIDAMCLYAGQSVGLVRRRQPAAQIVTEIREQTTKILRNLAQGAGYNSPGDR